MYDLNINKGQIVLQGEDVRKSLVTGLDMLADAVSATLGPRGRNVSIYRGSTGTKPHLTKDGVTVAAAINPSDPAVRMGVEIVKEVSKQACDEAGDGTTTATVLARAIVHSALDIISGNPQANPVAMQRGIEVASKALQDKLIANSIECTTEEKMIKVATISANGDDHIGKMAGKAVYGAGEYGCVLVEEYKGSEDVLVDTKGIRLEHGYINASFINDKIKQLQVIENVALVLIDGVLSDYECYRQAIIEVPQGTTVLFVADDFDPVLVAAVTKLMLNEHHRNKGAIKTALVKSSGYGLRRKEMLRDLAVYTGGMVTGDEGDVSPENFTSDMLGYASKVILDRQSGIVISDAGDDDEIQGRINIITEQLAEPDVKKFDIARFKQRIGLLAGRVYKIRVGADTDIGMRERKDRYDDAVCAVTSAREKGILAGGGTALLVAASQLEPLAPNTYDVDFIAGYNCVIQSIAAPAVVISKNAGLDGNKVVSEIIDKIKQDINHNGVSNYGYNAATGVYGDMIEMEVLDPAKVTCSAIKYAASIAGSFITTEVGIVG